ncbi:MAG: ATP-dependent Clp protease ATP-binding subunit [Bradymonadaceae bacterium]|nr:ATP-dependent Clp protease ATP-binding subunit [Lujinxingiaceae bacterium]
MQTLYKDSLFDIDGRLRLENFGQDAREVMDAIRTWLDELDRRMFLPLDLMVVLLGRGHDELAALIAIGTDGMAEPRDVVNRLRVLAREIEEEPSAHGPALQRASFSRGFTRILEEAWEQVQDREIPTISEKDLVRSLIWRAEAVESASVRWAIRRLSEGKGDVLFDDRGLLRQDSFDLTAQGILQGSMKIAASHGTPFLGTPHLVAMLCSVKDSILWRSARARGMEPARLREELIRLIGTKPDPIPEFLVGRKTLTPRMIRMLAFAAKQATEQLVGEHHLVESFLADGGSSLELVQALGLEPEIRNAMGEPRVLAEVYPVEAAIQFASKRHPSPTLDLLGRDLTEEALAGKLPLIVGREMELQRVFNVLLRKEQRNPLLTGEAGVGKTALAVALAQKIASGRAPKKLQGYRVIEINGANLMSGTSYRGDLEARIKSLIEEAGRNVILFIDEAHAVFSPRSGSNTPAEVPNHFKSALASGTIAVVGATTEAEYHRWFEQDPALKRRFERIEVPEPDRDLVVHILSSLVDELERDYEVVVEDDAVECAIELSTRYLPEQRLPDKAKKLLMDACIAESNRFIIEDEAADEPTRVGRRAIASQIHLKTGIPVDRLLRGEINWWVGIEARLKSVVLGQDQAISEVARALVGSRLRHSSSQRPLAAMLFIGPSGVGKSTLAHELAVEIFNDPRALIRLDMTDYQEAHALSRLIGSPPGYVGYEDADMLVTPLRRRPSSVVLLEDFDRAHPRIQERILRFIEEGELADTRGHKADAQNAVFILTINVHSGATGATIGFGDKASSRKPVEQLEGQGDRASLTRIRELVDAVITFDELGGGGASPAIELLTRRIAMFASSMYSEYKVRVVIDEGFAEVLKERAAQMTDGRSVDQLVTALLYTPMTDALLGGSAAPELIMKWDGDAERVQVAANPSS